MLCRFVSLCQSPCKIALQYLTGSPTAAAGVTEAHGKGCPLFVATVFGFLSSWVPEFPPESVEKTFDPRWGGPKCYYSCLLLKAQDSFTL